MKKLVMLLATVCAVGITQGAFVNWAINLGKDNYANKQYYVFAGSKSSDVLALLGAYDSNTSSSLDSLALASGTLNAKAGKASGNSLDVGSETSLYMVVLNAALGEGTTYIADTMDISSYVYTPPATPPNGAFSADNASFTGSGTIAGGGSGGGVPEPTSGLLLLVGGAMLALRRKQK